MKILTATPAPAPASASAVRVAITVSTLLGALFLGGVLLAPLPRAEAGTWPLRPRPEVASGFVAPSHRWGPGHRGVDLVGLPGQTVLAAAPGRVAFVGSVAGVAVVSVAHPDGRRTTYQPVVSALPVGHPLAQGEPLGALLPLGSHCAPATCLHWGLKQGDAYLDPRSLITAERIRLLPLPPP